MLMNKLEKIISCMFCRKTKDEVNKLFTSKKANICDDCVKIAFNFKNDDNDVSNEADKGYIEVRIDDGLINNPKDFDVRSFSLNSLSAALDDNLDHEISIELINKNSTRLEPPTKDTLRIKIEKDLSEKPDTKAEVVAEGPAPSP